MRLLNIAFVAVILSLFSGCFIFDTVGNVPKVVTSNPEVVSKEGWRGVAYSKDYQVFYKKFDSLLNDGRFDLWRYYDGGVLVREEVDRNSDDLIDFIVYYDNEKGLICGIERDDNFDGNYDYVVSYSSFNNWTEKWDKDFDGNFDTRFKFKGGIEFLSTIIDDSKSIVDLKKYVPAKKRVAIFYDDNSDGVEDRVVTYRMGKIKEKKLGYKSNRFKHIFNRK